MLATWGCAMIFKDATRIQNGHQNQIQNILWAQKLENSEIFQILLSYPPRYEDVHVIFSRFH